MKWILIVLMLLCSPVIADNEVSSEPTIIITPGIRVSAGEETEPIVISDKNNGEYGATVKCQKGSHFEYTSILWCNVDANINWNDSYAMSKMKYCSVNVNCFKDIPDTNNKEQP